MSELHYKGKFVSKAVHNHRIQMRETGKKRRRPVPENIQHSPEVPVAETTSTEEAIQDTNENFDNRQLDYMEGRRIVEFAILAQQMWCVSCKEALSLQYSEQETRRGLASILQVRCHKCMIINIVDTGKRHTSSNSSMHRFDVNSKIVLGKSVTVNCNIMYITQIMHNN